MKLCYILTETISVVNIGNVSDREHHSSQVEWSPIVCVIIASIAKANNVHVPNNLQASQFVSLTQYNGQSELVKSYGYRKC